MSWGLVLLSSLSLTARGEGLWFPLSSSGELQRIGDSGSGESSPGLFSLSCPWPEGLGWWDCCHVGSSGDSGQAVLSSSSSLFLSSCSRQTLPLSETGLASVDLHLNLVFSSGDRIKDRLCFFLLWVLVQERLPQSSTFKLLSAAGNSLLSELPCSSTSRPALSVFSTSHSLLPFCRLSYCFLAFSHTCTRLRLGGFLQGKSTTFLSLDEDRSPSAFCLFVSEASAPWQDEITVVAGCVMAEKAVFQKWRPSRDRSPPNSASSRASRVPTVSLRPPTSLEKRRGKDQYTHFHLNYNKSSCRQYKTEPDQWISFWTYGNFRHLMIKDWVCCSLKQMLKLFPHWTSILLSDNLPFIYCSTLSIKMFYNPIKKPVREAKKIPQTNIKPYQPSQSVRS